MANVNEIRRLMQDAGIARGKVDSLADDDAFDDHGLDSFDRMSLLTELEEHFDVEIPESQARGLSTLNAIVEYLNKP